MLRWFEADHAQKHGINAALIIEYFHEHRDDEDAVFVDGKKWKRVSVRELNEVYPFMSKKMIINALNTLVSNGVLVTENMNANKIDRTKWYAFTGRW